MRTARIADVDAAQIEHKRVVDLQLTEEIACGLPRPDGNRGFH